MKIKCHTVMARLLFIIISFVSCSPNQQGQIQTEVVKAGQTAVAVGGELVATEAARLQETVAAAVATEAAHLQETAVAAVATQLAGSSGYEREFDNVANQDEFLVGAYLYPWWGPDRNHWSGGYANHPSLGEYTSADSSVINKQIDWATGHGIDFFAVSWWGQSSNENLTLLNSILTSDLATDMHFAILYESTGRLSVSADGTIDLNDSQNQQKLFDDFLYIQSTYWNDSRYLRINNKPVVFIYLTRIMKGDLSKIFGDLRNLLQENGNEVYIIGDEVYWQTWHLLDTNRIRTFDGITAYNMHASIPDIAVGFTERVSEEFSSWRSSALNSGVAFIPSVMPGFNDTFVRPQENHPIIARSIELFGSQLDMAFSLLDTSIKMMMITSWNEWHEDTSIEPAQEFGFDFLEVLQQKLTH